MFDKNKFAQIIKNIKETYNSQEEFSKKSGIGRTYLSQYMNMKLDKPPKPEILEKLANASRGIVNYGQLMGICGYLDEDVKNELINKLKLLQIDLPDLQKAVTAFIENYITITDDHTVNIYEDENSVAYYAYELITKMYFKLKRKKICQLLNIPLTTEKEIYNFNIPNSINKVADEYAWNEIQNIIEDLNELDVISNLTSEEKVSRLLSNLDITSQFYMCPVYGRISAGQPNWAEECIEGRLPIDVNLMNIIDPEECFFLRVNGESMNKVVKNGAFALIRKTDWVENGEIAVVLVNGYDATLKKFSKQGDLIILEPQSTDSSFETQVYTKDTEIRVIGKYIGKMEMK